MVTLKDIAERIGLPKETVRRILNEAPNVPEKIETVDLVFQTARGMGYDFRKLQIGRTLETRRVTIQDLLSKIGENPDWDRDRILGHIRDALSMVERVQNRAFQEEFAEGGSDLKV